MPGAAIVTQGALHNIKDTNTLFVVVMLMGLTMIGFLCVFVIDSYRIERKMSSTVIFYASNFVIIFALLIWAALKFFSDK